MDKKVELQVLNISNSQVQAGAYAMLLGEVDGKRQLPIIIGPAEAQSTALCLKGLKTPRPLTHELFTTCLQALGVSLIRVLIYKAKEGVFYSYIYLQRNEEIIRIDARTSDAIALAVRSESPIFIYDSILERECVRLEDMEEEETGEEKVAGQEDTQLDTLEEELARAIKNENYELAARLRDQIRRLK